MNDLKNFFKMIQTGGDPNFKISVLKSFPVAIYIVICMQFVAAIVGLPGKYWTSLLNVTIPLSYLAGGVFAIMLILPMLNISWDVIKKHIMNPTSIALILLSTLLYVFLIPFTEMIGSIVPTAGNSFLEELYEMFKSGFEMMMDYKIAGFITVCILAPILEEILFRGVLLRGLLQNGTSPIIAIFVSSLLFGAAHLNPWQFIAAGFLGAIFGFVYYRTRSLWLCMFLHALNNTISFVFMIKEGTLEGSVSNSNNFTSVTVFFFLAIICSWMIYKLTKNKPEWS
ncbi:MAG: type II CAAX endopeptidase family protein [Moheibacter sp.]